MTPKGYTEDQLVQRTTAEYLHDQLGWESVYAYNEEDFGPDSLLGRKSDREIVLTRYLRAALVKLNPGLPVDAYHEAVRQIVEISASQTILVANREKYKLLRDGVPVAYRNAGGELVKQTLQVFDFGNPKETTSAPSASSGFAATSTAAAPTSSASSMASRWFLSSARTSTGIWSGHTTRTFVTTAIPYRIFSTTMRWPFWPTASRPSSVRRRPSTSFSTIGSAWKRRTVERSKWKCCCAAC